MNIITKAVNWIRGTAGPVRSAKFHQTRAKLEGKYREIRAKYEAAAYTDENTKHWTNADSLSAKAANTLDIRQTLRERARLEYDNSCYCKGMTRTYANEIIGTGPRVQIQTTNEKANQGIEQLFGNWCEAVALCDKLQMTLKEELVSGELFFLKTTNPAIDDPVQLDLRPIETDQVTTPYQVIADPKAVDGIHFDRHGNPRLYDVLKYHPGGEGEFGGYFATYEVQEIKAADMLHWFRAERPGQVRGIPTLTPSLPLHNQLRRYTQAVLSAAELAASFAGIIKTAYPPGSDANNDPEPWELVDIVKGMLQTLPLGADITQMRAEQPTNTYADFVDKILREICRCIEMPFSIATGDSSDSSYASGRLEVQSWQRKCVLERNGLQRRLLNPIFKAWLAEARLIDGYLPIADVGPPESWRKFWQWDGWEHVDPVKKANADDTNLRNLATTLEQVHSAQGRDWIQVVEQAGRELKKCQEHGVPHPLQAAIPAPPAEEQVTEDAGGEPPQEQEVAYAAAA